MANTYFQFKQFIIHQEQCAMKVGTDGVLLGAWANAKRVHRMLDIGTGTGLIALMLAQRFNARIDAVELDENAYLQAKENIQASKWHERIQLHHDSFQHYAKNCRECYSLIVCNPPYFENKMQSADIRRSLARHTIRLSYHDLLKWVSALLDPSGRFAVIIPSFQLNRFRSIASKYGLHCWRICFVLPKPLADPHRVLLELKGRYTYSPVIRELAIEKEKRHQYTPEFIRLVKDFYLNH